MTSPQEFVNIFIGPLKVVVYVIVVESVGFKCKNLPNGVVKSLKTG